MPVASTPCGEAGEGWPGDKATLPLLLWLCVEKRASSSGLVWQQREAFLLLFADPQHPLPFLHLVSAPVHILWLCPNARLAPSLDASYPPRSSSSVYWFRPPLLCLGSCTSSVSRPACPSISVCLPRTRGGRTRLLSL